MLRWLARRRERRLSERYERRRREMHHLSDIAEYLDAQLARVNVEIVRTDAEMTGLRATRDAPVRRLAEANGTQYQIEALYRQA